MWQHIGDYLGFTLLGLLAPFWAAVLYLLWRALTPRVFISYRRDDTGPTADRLWVDLTDRYGEGKAFLDKEDIPYNEPWSSVLVGWLGISNVVVALVGHKWDGGLGPDEYPRILNEYDWVRREVETALDEPSKVFLVAFVVPNGGDKPEVPVYEVTQLDIWNKGREAQLLERLRGLQRDPTQIGVEGKEYRRGRKALFGEIDRKYGGYKRWLLRGWYALALPLILLGVQGYTSINTARQARETIQQIINVQAEHKKRLQAQSEAIKSLQPDLLLPYSLKAFAEIVRNDPNKSKDFQGCSVAWQAQIVEHGKPDDEGKLLVTLEPIQDIRPPFRVRSNVSNLLFQELPKNVRIPKGRVWVIGVLFQCSTEVADLQDARLKPDSSATD